MGVWRYQTCGTIEINASAEQVYALVSNPDVVPSYAPEIRKIEVVKHFGNGSVLVRSYFKVGGMTFPCLYRYQYRPPRYYGGFQRGGKLLRGYFSFSFTAAGGRTKISHTEGLLSSVPGLASVAGFIYFRLLSRHGIEQELAKVKELVEAERKRPPAMVDL